MLAFVFPGQGSQAVGMLDGFAGNDVVKDAVSEASSAIGEDLWGLIASGPAEVLGLTVNTQPAMLAADVAMYRAWLAAGGARPDFVAGHSLGEYAALVAADAIDLGNATRCVRFRAEAMQQAVPAGTGSMAAILGLAPEAVRAACEAAAEGQIVAPANYNEPSQTVIAGHVQAVDRACAKAKELGAKRALVLPVSAPFHSSLMQPAAEKLRQWLDGLEIRPPVVPIINNCDVAMPSEPAQIRDSLVRQAFSAVRWIETVELMRHKGVSTIIECGPGKVLSGLCKRIDREMTVLSINDPSSLAATLDALS